MEHYKKRKTEHKTTEKKCKKCGKTFLAKSTLAKFCSSSCKQDNFNEKKTEKRVNELIEKINEIDDIMPGLKILLDAEDLSDIEIVNLHKKDGIINDEVYKVFVKLLAEKTLYKNELKTIKKDS